MDIVTITNMELFWHKFELTLSAKERKGFFQLMLKDTHTDCPKLLIVIFYKNNIQQTAKMTHLEFNLKDIIGYNNVNMLFMSFDKVNIFLSLTYFCVCVCVCTAMLSLHTQKNK